MSKYHINPKTGKISLCKANIKCRYGADSEHYETISKAKNFIEEYEKDKNKLFASNKKIVHSPLTDINELFKYNKHYYSFSDELTDSEYRAMEYYTTHGSGYINEYLNGGRTDSPEQAASFDNFIKEIDSFIEKAPKYEKRVYRGIGLEKSSKFLNEEYNIGEEITFNNYSSSSIDPLISLNFSGEDGVVLIIDTEKGAPPHATGVFGGERPQDLEREIILPRGESYTITNYSFDYFKNKDGKIKKIKTVYLKGI